MGTRSVKWNFTKFLVGRDGEVIERFSSRDEPEAMIPAIEKALG
jgi:glutathione peroxidase